MNQYSAFNFQLLFYASNVIEMVVASNEGLTALAPYIGFAPSCKTETIYLNDVTPADRCVRVTIQSEALDVQINLDACRKRCLSILTVCGGQKRRFIRVG